MKFSKSTIIGIILGGSVFLLYVLNVRPVGLFDSAVGIALAVIVFLLLRTSKVSSKSLAE